MPEVNGKFIWPVLEPFGPIYPDLGLAVARHRRQFRMPLKISPPAMRRAYGEAVLAAIRAKQRQSLQRELPSHQCMCPSGTFHNTGEAILAAIAAQHRNTPFVFMAKQLERRMEKQTEKYEEAMAAKRAAVVTVPKRRRRAA